MTSTLAVDTIRDIRGFKDEMQGVIQQMDTLRDVIYGDSNCSQLCQQIQGKIAIVTASMESLEKEGINQDVVNSLNIAIPNILQDIPLNSYTTQLSSINVGYALEALGDSKLKLVKGWIQTGIAAIIKVVTWFINIVKDYIKRRKMPAVVGLNVVKQLDQYDPPVTAADTVLEQLKKTKEYGELNVGFDWLLSLTQHAGSVYTYSDTTMQEWWPEIANELVYEYDQLKLAYQALLSGDSYQPNIAPVRQSPAIHRFYLALPQGLDRQGKVVSRDDADKHFQKDPFGAMVSLSEHLRYMMLSPSKVIDQDLVTTALMLAKSMETYNAADKLVFDSLASTEVTQTMTMLNKGFGALYKDIQSRQHATSIETVERFVTFVNMYSEKLNCFSQLITCIFFLDTATVNKITQLSQFVNKYIQLNSASSA